MDKTEKDLEFERGLLTRKMNTGEDVVIDTDRAVVLRNVNYPRAEFHFLVLPKEDIVNVTKLTNEHLPLLDHMMDLANQIMEKQHLPSSNFRVGFKINAFMSRLTMHVISDDFCSARMFRLQHWNTFNTDLFLPFQAVYALLRVHGSVEPMPADMVEKLRMTKPVHCNQCSYITHNFDKFREHLAIHWRRRMAQRLCGIGLAEVSQSMGNLHLNGNRNGNPQPMRHPFHLMRGAHPNQFLHHPRALVAQQQHFQRPNQQFRFPNHNSVNYRQSAPHPTANDSQQTKPNVGVGSDGNAAQRQQQAVDGASHQPSDAMQPFVKKKYYNKQKKKTQA